MLTARDELAAGNKLVASEKGANLRYRNKHYFRIPGGEIQYGRISRSLAVWWRGKRYIVCSGRPS